MSKGSDLVAILKAGGWRSSAFRSYLDIVGIENKIASSGADALVDLDESGER